MLKLFIFMPVFFIFFSCVQVSRLPAAVLVADQFWAALYGGGPVAAGVVYAAEEVTGDSGQDKALLAAYAARYPAQRLIVTPGFFEAAELLVKEGNSVKICGLAPLGVTMASGAPSLPVVTNTISEAAGKALETAGKGYSVIFYENAQSVAALKAHYRQRENIIFYDAGLCYDNLESFVKRLAAQPEISLIINIAGSRAFDTEALLAANSVKYRRYITAFPAAAVKGRYEVFDVNLKEMLKISAEGEIKAIKVSIKKVTGH
jgi:hypothetical protein